MAKRKHKAKAKEQRKTRAGRTRRLLADVNLHCAQLTTALRNLADRLDDIRSYHLDKEM
jgi:hypothetical protein